MMVACGGGSRRQGRPGRRWMDEMHEVSGMKLVELRDMTTERKRWRRLIMTAQGHSLILKEKIYTTVTFFDVVQNGQFFDKSLVVTSFDASVHFSPFRQQVRNFPIQLSLRGLMILSRYEICLL